MHSLLQIYVLIISALISTAFSSELKLLFVIHRHGDRTPIQCYPMDPYSNASYWPDGWGELTPVGKKRMFGVGSYLRKRYQHFLSDNPREVRIRSSGADRCLETVALVMAGLYRPEGRWQWSDNLGHEWQPFPIQTEPREMDGMLNSGSKCLVAEQELTRIHNSPEVIQYVNQRKAVLNYVSSNTGLNITNLTAAEEVFDTLLIEKENKYELPLWVDEHTYHTLSQISDMTFYFDFSTKLIQRLRTVNDLIPGDWNSECQNTGLSFASKTVMPYMFGSLLTLAVMALIYIIYTFLKPKNREIVYQMLPIR
ncbi:unnamed protein product [Medioppia subpectinata]|uniref:Lysosomal acid phosphatase n=1 Tax=Medioppia subpectinata TaxID=1979941 RepID=A0A7R9KVS4_9ACAR|nr:unnamed protein product [Medioppia subpectinata]CAG2110632.1 unnamed protein product [Medioppia subpectinata]